MEITFQYFEDCPTWQTSHQRLREVIGDRDDIDLIMQRVQTPEEAAAVGFRGSPTILVEGVDPFDDRDAPPAGTMACRVYQTPDGSPTVEQILEAVGSR